MQFSADFVALGMHQADVHRAEREIGRRRDADERGSSDMGSSSEPVGRRRHRSQRQTPQLVLR